tara:strand:+ start:25 stop:972 length:948 start_codon:yes stop_codon:yes gene_type:complete
MIDKSIRQHYEEGKKVKKLKLVEMGEKLTSPLKNKYIAQDTGKIKKGEIAKDIGINFAKKAVAKKLGLASLNPILGILSFLFKNWGEGGVKEAYQAGMTGFGSTAKGKELSQLEARRANMLRRKEEGKNYSKKNLEEVTNQINKIKKTAPTTKKASPISYEDDLATTTIKDILDKDYGFEDKKTAPLKPTPIIDYESEAYGITPTAPIRQDPDTGDASIAEKIAAENRAATQAAAVKAENDRQQREADVAAAAAARAAAARSYSSPARPHGNGGGNQGASNPRGGGFGRSGEQGGFRWAQGGRVDKPLTGRSRDI